MSFQQVPIKRRNFLKLSAVTTASVMLSQCSRQTSFVEEASSNLLLPDVIKSENGLLSLDLEASAQSVSLNGKTANLLTYNQQSPGPQLEAKPGDTVQIRFTNRLNQPTNLHFHGLHISPTGTGDNVFLEISPGESHTYEFQIPEDHPAGTFWYHPHYHGLVAEQLFAGLAGLFIVRGALDDIPEVKAAKETALVLKDLALDRRGNIPNPGHMAQMTGRIGDLLLANGQLNPEIKVAQGELLRLRLLNASPSRFFQLSLEAHPLLLIATDGGAISAPIELDNLVLAPGERAEVLIRSTQTSGQYRLLNTLFNPAQGMMGGSGMMGDPSRQRRTETVATLAYSGTTTETPLPTALLPIAPLPEPQRVRQFTLNHEHGMVFLINGQAFDHSRVDTQVSLGTVEDWEIINTGAMAHPFHVHVNKFQVISRNGQTEPYAAWKDVVSINPGERVRIRMAFQNYTGRTVYHCHVLDHEDRGMMGILDIQSA
ncbi:MAG: multicopper oxidase family protein [Cyanobacteria bacterium P01_D01_bin.156]